MPSKSSRKEQITQHVVESANKKETSGKGLKNLNFNLEFVFRVHFKGKIFMFVLKDYKHCKYLYPKDNPAITLIFMEKNTNSEDEDKVNLFGVFIWNSVRTQQQYLG